MRHLTRRVQRVVGPEQALTPADSRVRIDRSVTDARGRVWGHDNLRVADASVHVTNGGVRPVFTIFVNAFRMMHGTD